MTVLIISTCSNKLHEEEFVRPVTQIIETSYEVKQYLEKINFENYSHIIICGTALKDYKYLEEDFSWIKECEKPLLGICAGSQVIAREFGEEIKGGEEIGLIEIEQLKKDKILENVKLNEIYCLHNKYIEMPQGFDLILKTKYPQLFRKENIVCSLFHPEVRNKELIRNFLNI